MLPRCSDIPAGLDGVVIATPSATHAELALPFIERGIATFIEKPMVTSMADALRIRDAAKFSGAAVFVGHLHLYNPAFHAACQMLPELGPVTHVICEWMNASPRPSESVLWDWLPHVLAMARVMLREEPDSAASWGLVGDMHPQAAATRFQFGTVPLMATASWVSACRSRRMVVAGEQATLVFDDAANRKLVRCGLNGDIGYPPYEADRPLARELSAFLDMVRGAPSDRDHIADAIVITRAILAAERSLREHGIPIAI